MGIDTQWDVNDWQLARDLFQSKASYTHRKVIVRKFRNYQTRNPDRPTIEQFRTPVYDERADHVWLSWVRVFDTVKGGYFTTGDMDVNSSFQLIGFSPAYIRPNGVRIEEYAGDELIWNGKIWIVSDQVEPIQFGMKGGVVYWRTVMRRVDRSSQGF